MALDDAPLEGTRILDLTRVLAGPFATLLLAQMGAEVVKVEPIGGDAARGIPPFMERESSYFLSVNSGKQSVAVDLGTPEGRDIVHELAATCDAALENFRPQTALKLGVDFERLREANPRIVVCSITGFGIDSSAADALAYDLTVQAMSGLIAVTGHAGAPPARLGVPMADLIGGMNAALGTVAAMRRSAEDGVARHVDASLFDGALSLLSYVAGAALATGREPGPVGSGHHSIVPYGAYPASDGWLTLAVLTDKFWPRLCRALDLEEVADDTDLARNEGRVRRRAEVDELIGQRLSTLTREEALARLESEEVPCAPVNSVLEALDLQLTQERTMVRTHQHPVIGNYRALGPAIRFHPSSDAPLQHAPVLGEHTRAVLAGLLRYSDMRINELIDQGILRSADDAGTGSQPR